jgi:hypothetical protein
MKTLVLLISGKQGSGKTTLAQGLFNKFLESRIVQGVYAMKFADPLYDMQKAIAAVMDRYDYPIKTPDGRLLQLLGTEWGRSTIDKNLWVKLAQIRIEKLLESQIVRTNRLIIIDDARFPNEIEAFDEFQKFWPEVEIMKLRLEAPEHVRQVRAEKWRTHTDHPSEVALDGYHGWDKVLFTDTTNAADGLSAVTQLIEEKYA